ncbi:hypothetical protein ACFE04_018539 [Oxalis oulophora]
MGKNPVRMKAVVYALSPFQQKVMPGLWKDITTKIHHKVSENWISTILLVGPVVGTYSLWFVALTLDKWSYCKRKFPRVCPVLCGAGKVVAQVLKECRELKNSSHQLQTAKSCPFYGT